MYAATKGYLDKVAVGDITKAEAAVLKHVNPDIYKVCVCVCLKGGGGSSVCLPASCIHACILSRRSRPLSVTRCH